MSRIGNRVIVIPEGVTVNTEGNLVKVSGPKGNLEMEIKSPITIEVNGNEITLKSNSETKEANMLHGTMNSNLTNILKGVKEGFSKGLEIIGVGYKFGVRGDTLVINAGYSHPVDMKIPTGIKVEAVSNTEITISGCDKVLVGEFAANVRKVRKPEPYKGKGIRYKDEYVRRKEGKKAAK
jgi:large subunit ribosomal protein L6